METSTEIKSTEPERIATRAGLHRFSLVLAVATVILLVAGALVTSNSAGDTISDWPLSLGRWVLDSDQFHGGARYEYSHRVIAGIVAILTFGLAAWTWMSRSADRTLKLLMAFALIGVLLQAGLGGLRVLMPEYKPQMAVPHALIAQTFYALIVVFAVLSSPRWETSRSIRIDKGPFKLRSHSTLTAGLMLIQLVLGAAYRHGAMDIIPHIVGAVVIALMVTFVLTNVLQNHMGDPYLRKPALLAAMLLLLQLGVGVAAYISKLKMRDDFVSVEPMVTLTVAHVTIGALLLTVMVVMMLRANQTLVPIEMETSGAEPQQG